ncbi:protein Shroom4 [Trichomycterus rosablanca]|uniref:protein Shroom4 n=1 Tax=Trichomycterus rosablanca TaxID=2290929 RepID=UPI002F3536C9
METVEQLVTFNHIHVELNGGAPWGFTLKGGLEHGEPLIVTKIEEGGKAAECKKLRVGDELVNINGSALYGSRQEALILIKGSYRVLKIVVRRRSVPLFRPQSWHLLKSSEAPSVPGPVSGPDGPPAMQLHPTPFSVPWHSGGDSELSMPLGHLSRHYSTDRSSSVGSMESLENPPNQGYYDSQLSPIDPAIFNNKRDSAYSSFSASSNTSDYTVSLRPEENSSMDSLLQGFGPSCRFPEGRPHSVTSGPGEMHCEEGLKSRTLPYRPEGKTRPSSYGYEEEKCAPPPPPMRKESFRATRTQPGVTDKRCVSAPVGIPSLNCTIEDPPHVLNGRVCLNGAPENDQDLKDNKSEPYYVKHPQRDICKIIKDPSTEQCQTLGRYSTKAAKSPDNQLNHFENNHQSRMHRHSAPEKLLASELGMMELSSDNKEHIISPSSQWSNALHPREELTENSSDVVAHGKWGGSRCSTPGSVTYSELGEQDEPIDSSQRLTSAHNSWECSTSAPGEKNAAPSIDPQVQEICFGTISSASSMDTLLEENQEQEESREDESEVLKAPQKRHFRSSKSRRRNERFATNLRNEIQRQKAQLHKCKGSGGLLCGSETLEEEDSSNIYMEEASSFKPSSINQHQARAHNSQNTSFQNVAPTQVRSSLPDRFYGSKDVESSRSKTENIHVSQDDTHGVKSVEVSRSVSVQVVEELAPPGKARRWRWTPEHKLQPDTGSIERKKSGEEKKQSSWNYGTTRGRIGSTGGRSSRGDDCDIPPFADRRKFFEETSKNLSQSVTNLAGLTSHRQRPERPARKNELSTSEPIESVSNLGCRRFSYQGGVHDVGSTGSLETRRQLVNAHHEIDREREKTLEREQVKEREQEGERTQERKQDIPNEQERVQAWTMAQKQDEEREQERLRKKNERESQRVQQVERDWDNNRENIYAGHDLKNITVLPPLPHETHQKQPFISQNLSHHNYNSDNSNIKHNADIPKPCSAFRPVTSQQYQSTQYFRHPGFQTRSCTPTEVYPVQKLEQTKLNRKFSLTERDYVQCRCDCRQEDLSVGWGIQGQRNNRLPAGNNEKEAFMLSPLRNRAMSENDIRIDTQSLHSHVAAASTTRMSSSVLKELDENVVPVDGPKKKKGPAPPRPPPPKWEQFHKRRASHHNLFSSQSAFSSQVQVYTPGPPTVSEMARQRSYSLPPRDGTESHQQGYQTCPPAPAFNHSAFKPVTPPSKEQETNRSQHYDVNSRTDIPSPSTENSSRLSDQSLTDQHRPAVLKPVIHKHKAEWDLTSPHNYTVTTTSRKSPGPAPSLENGSCTVLASPQSCFSINNNHQQHLQNRSQQTSISDASLKNLETSGQCSPPSNDQMLPFETDIDEIHENQAASEEQQKQTEERAEMQCYAQPVTVLETDIDTVTVETTSLTGMRRGQRASVVDSLLEENCGRARKELMGELFPQYAQAKTGAEGWRGGYPVSGDTLERSSRQSSLALQDPASASYKAQLLNKMPNFSNVKEEDEELNYKKQLMESLRKKLGVLREAQRGLQEDIRANAQLGEEVESLVLAVCKPNEVDKFRMFIGDLDKVTSLLLSLSGRLLRVESALECLDPESCHRERLPLMEKKKQLLEQLAEAQELKEHVDRREEAVGRVLGRCLTPEQLRDYSHFVKMKAALLVEQRQLDDKIRLGEEQLNGLKESLGMGFCPY